MRIVIQVGWVSTRKEGQKLSAWVNNDEVNWDTFPGKWLTSQAHRKYMMWHMCDLDLLQGDDIKIICQTGLKGLGADETRTFDLRYVVGTEFDDVVEYMLPDVGCRGYPIIKGRVIELSNVTKEDERHIDAEDFLEDGF